MLGSMLCRLVAYLVILHLCPYILRSPSYLFLARGLILYKGLCFGGLFMLHITGPYNLGPISVHITLSGHADGSEEMHFHAARNSSFHPTQSSPRSCHIPKL
ncbi:hypothetical protein F5B19DRAFT_175664 [Rostrohypoxylon terebratum]|nr:hypothetical protein F5B19DRAFT_175664 [Rostrohypoxylon terebratum]